MQRGGRWDRGSARCQAVGCNDYSAVALSAQLSTSGGRRGRVQVRAASVRLCNACLDKLAEGKMPKALAECIHVAVTKVRRAE